MMKFLIAAAAMAVPGAAFALDAKPASAAEAAGLAYSTTLADDGTVIFQGREQAGGNRFRLKMFSDGSVAGTVGPAHVRYAVEKQVRDRVVAKLRQRAAGGDTAGGLN